jgi:hypothetical protein
MICRRDTFKPQSRSADRRRNSRRALAGMLLALASIGSMTGCNAWSGAKDGWNYSSGWNGMMMKYRNDAWANKAWHSRKHQFCNERHNHEFCEGFRAGYADVADGGTGCSPAFPPRQYWGWKYQSAEGQSKVSSWYAGYPHGARAAEEDGIGNWTQIQTSMAVQNQLADHNKLGDGQVAGMYPMPQAQPPAAALAKARNDAAASGAAGKMVSAPAETFEPTKMNFAPTESYPTVANPNPIPLEAKADNSIPIISPLVNPVR